MRRLTSMSWRNFAGGAGWLKLGLAVAAALAVRGAAAQPANDNFASATAIYGYTGSATGNNVGATLEGCEPATVNAGLVALVTNSVWYVWTAPAGGTVTFDPTGSSFETVLAVYTTTNSLCAGLALVAANDNTNYPAQTNSQASFMATNGVTYYISVNSKLTGAAGAYVLNWNLPPAPTSPGTLSAGAFLFTTNMYVVADVDSSARVTVTRTPPAFGRVLVDYSVAGLTYTNILTTNYYGSNVLVTITYTNGQSPTINNTYYTNTVFTNSYQFFNARYQYFGIGGGYTNLWVVSNGTTNQFSSPGVLGSTNFNVPRTTYNTTTTVTVSNSADGSTIVTNTTLFSYVFTTNQVVQSAAGIATNTSGTLDV